MFWPLLRNPHAKNIERKPSILRRKVVSERTRAGLDRAREKGTRSGRPIGRPRLVFRRNQVRELRKEGLSWRQIAVRLHASPTAVRRAHAAGF